jgi:hypothetical protein
MFADQNRSAGAATLEVTPMFGRRIFAVAVATMALSFAAAPAGAEIFTLKSTTFASIHGMSSFGTGNFGMSEHGMSELTHWR